MILSRRLTSSGFRRIYLVCSASALVLALAQLLSLPVFLAPAELSVVAMTFSVTQAMLQFGDAGYANAASNRTLSPLKRRLFRSYGTSVAYLSGAVSLIGILVLCCGGVVPLGLAAPIALGVVTGTILISTKMSASQAMQEGSERKATVLSFVWQNVAKPGQLIGSSTGSALVTAVGGLVCASVLARPGRVGPLRGVVSLPRYRRHWMPGLSVVAMAFVMSWLDTYLVAGALSLYDAGLYQAIYRPMLGATYIFLPAVAVIQANLNADRRSRAARIAAATLVLTALALSTLAVLLVAYGSDLWSRYRFPPDVVAALAVAVGMYAVSTLTGTVLLVDGRTRAILLANVGGAAVMVLTTTLLIPVLGLTGAAVAAAASWAVAALIQVAAVIRGRRGAIPRHSRSGHVHATPLKARREDRSPDASSPHTLRGSPSVRESRIRD